MIKTCKTPSRRGGGGLRGPECWGQKIPRVNLPVYFSEGAETAESVTSGQQTDGINEARAAARNTPGITLPSSSGLRPPSRLDFC